MNDTGRAVADWATRQHDLDDAMRRAGRAFAGAQDRGRLRRWHLDQPPPTSLGCDRTTPTPPLLSDGQATEKGPTFDD